MAWGRFAGCSGLALAACCLMQHAAMAQGVLNYAVQVSAVAQTNPPQISLAWPADPSATNFLVYRKTRQAPAWGPGTSLGAGAVGFTDTNVSAGEVWEYRVRKGGTVGTNGFNGEGYVLAGIEAPLVEARDKVLLLLDRSITNALAAELFRLELDLAGDGWTVIRREVDRTAAVTNVKAVILSEYLADSSRLKSLFLLGRVPVPYSGDFAPDGHPEHVGAWPADVFYGELNGTWTDTQSSTNLPADPRNRNLAGDGKFDQTELPSDVELAVGRVDLSNLPAFGLSETELLRRYLNKDHRFRHRQITAERRGLVDDNFGAFDGEAFAGTAWRDFSAMFGSSNVQALDWFGTLASNRYLWGYGCGPGSYQGAGGVGTTSQFVSVDPKVIFTMLFGSYLGDWDTPDNFLRAPLASASYGLACAWAGRPWWEFHSMALGETIGYCARVSQNNSTLYAANFETTRLVHVALMGDPTLRMHVVAPPGVLQVNSNGAGGLELRWLPSPDPVAGYHVYRAPTYRGPFARLNASLITGTNYTEAVASTNLYMVRAVALETSGSGTYWNASQGVFQDATGQFNHPRLHIAHGGDPAKATTLSWATAADPATLQVATNLASPQWRSITNVTTTNGINQATVIPGSGAEFFRLITP